MPRALTGCATSCCCCTSLPAGQFFLSQHDRTRVKTTDTLYHGKQAAGDSLKFHGKTT
jgi:hypothetical protein